MTRTFLAVLFMLCICSHVHALQLAELQSETVEDLLLFFEEEELVIATRRPTPVNKAPAIATVITAKEIKDMGARNLMDVLKMVPGFGISINEGPITMLEVRGIRTLLSEKVLLMIDGHSMNRNTVGSAMRFHFNDLPVENIKQVEIIRGPGSALYGANAFMAVINITTRDAEEISGIEVKGSYGSFDSKKANITGGDLFKNGIKLSGSVDYYNTDGAELTIDEDRLTGTPWSRAPGKTDRMVEKTDIFLKASYKDFTYRGYYLTKEAAPNIGTVYALVDSPPFKMINQWHEVSYHRNISDDLSSEIKIFYDHFEQKGNIELFPDGYLGLFPEGLIGGPYVKNDTYGAELQINYLFADTHDLTFGAAYEKLRQYDVRREANYLPPPTFTALDSVQETSPDVNWNQEADREVWAIFIQDELEIRTIWTSRPEFGMTTTQSLVAAQIQGQELSGAFMIRQISSCSMERRSGPRT